MVRSATGGETAQQLGSRAGSNQGDRLLWIWLTMSVSLGTEVALWPPCYTTVMSKHVFNHVVESLVVHVSIYVLMDIVVDEQR
jgi:hypothetical protein